MPKNFASLKGEYGRLLKTVKVTKEAAATAAAKKVLANSDRYKRSAAGTPVPWPLIGVLDLRESDCNPTRALGRGDRWDQVSVNVPRGKGPFPSYEAAAKFYIHYDGLDDPPAPYGMDVVCYMGEKWNGFGYRNHGVHTPYLWAMTNHQQPGRYAGDSNWKANEWDTQPGIIAVLFKMVELEPSTYIGTDIIEPIDDDTPIVPAPAPYSETGTKWIQSRLNILMVANSDDPEKLNLLRVDGNYGRRTRAAVIDFQRWQGLAQGGDAGDVTTAAMDAELAAFRSTIK